MKDKRPIATQVAELSDQQRKTIRRVGVCYDIVMCLVVVIYLAVTVFFLVQLQSANAQLEQNMLTQDYVPGQYADLIIRQEASLHTFVIIAAAGFLGVLAVMGIGLLIISTKYPYYSDKRFMYIGRLNRQSRKK